MSDKSNIFITREADNTCFGGANTPRGFVSDYPELLDEEKLTKIFIVKGGSGTGKSTLMRKAAAAAVSVGASAEFILCGSDPDSLDGVILERGAVRIALADGTAPHVLDPVYAGACGETVNCGDCWNSSVLEGARSEICDIINRKKELYSAAYRYLSGAAAAARLRESYAAGAVLEDKMEAFQKRLVSGLCGTKGGKGTIKIKRTLAVTMKGAVRLGVFDGMPRCISVEDCGYISSVFMESTAKMLADCGCNVTVSPSPVFGIGEICVPEQGISFVLKREGQEYLKNINLRRFVDREKLLNSRQKRRFADNCFAAMCEGALESLADAGKLHFALEDIYVKAMDFSKCDALSDDVCKRVLSYFS